MTLAALVTAVAASVAGAQAPPGGGGLVVFVSQRAPDLHRTLLVGTGRSERQARVLATLPELAVPSPDGRRYARPVFGLPNRFELVVGRIGGGESTIVTAAGSIQDVTWSHAGRRLAYTVTDGSRCGPASRACAVYELWVVDADGRAPHKIADFARMPTWSPDDRRLAFAGEWNTADENFAGRTGAPYVALAAGGGVRRLARLWGLEALAWSPGGDRIAFAAHRGFVAVVGLRGGDARRVGLGTAPAWSSRGRLAFAGKDGIRIVSRDGRPVRRIRANGFVQELAWAPGGAELAYLTFFRDPRRPDEGPKLVVTVREDGRGRRVVYRADRFAQVALAGWPRGASGVRVTTTRRQNDGDLFTMRGDGTGLRSVTWDDAYDRQPAWSPDGRRIVFIRGFAGGFGFPQTAVHVVDARGGPVTRITSPTAGTDDDDPDWSPDGTWIVFSRSLAASGFDLAELYLCRPDGAGLVQLTRLGGSNGNPAWSPDGRAIAFTHGNEVWVVGADGSGPRPLGLRGGQPAWSPDGGRIAFVGPVDNIVRLQIANADGSNGRVVPTVVPAAWSAPTWSPDGTRLVFESEDGELRSVALDGSDVLFLTVGAGLDADPDWSGAAGG